MVSKISKIFVGTLQCASQAWAHKALITDRCLLFYRHKCSLPTVDVSDLYLTQNITSRTPNITSIESSECEIVSNSFSLMMDFKVL